MNIWPNMMIGMELSRAPDPLDPWFTWGVGGNNGFVEITNPNDAPMTLSFGAWSEPARFGWVTSWPQTIPAHGTLLAHASTTQHSGYWTATASGTWSVDGGSSGSLTGHAEADYLSG